MLIQQDNFIQKLLSLEKGKPHIPDVRKKRTFFLNKLTDAKLVKYIRRGNNHAFEILIKRHEPKLKQIIRNSLFDKSMAEDVLQDVWELAIPQIKGRAYKEGGNFYGWLSTIAFRTTVEVNRQKKYNPEFTDYNPDFHDVLDFSEDSLEANDILEKAKKIISTFNRRDQEIIEMHNKHGFSFKRIAKEMCLNPQSVRVWHARSMTRIKERLLFPERVCKLKT